MKRSLLPLPESFTIHATALINKVHSRPRPERRDTQSSALTLMRNLGAVAQHPADYRNILSGNQSVDVTR